MAGERPNVINDNQTTVAGGIPAPQMEYNYQSAIPIPLDIHGLDVWTIDDRGVGYEFSYQVKEGEFSAKTLLSLFHFPKYPHPLKNHLLWTK
jgi:hypothetical protein